MLLWLSLALLLISGSNGAKISQPNIIFILTDDQDAVLGGMTPMTQVKLLLQDQGMTFTNMFTPTPICCPSRSSILTGRYSHNHNTLNNSISGNCSSPSWVNGPEKSTFAVSLQKAGYTTYFAGKYLNKYGTEAAGGPTHKPPGWNEWFALVGNSRYYNYTVSDNGKAVKHGDNYTEDYFTDVIGSKVLEWLNSHKKTSNGSPYMMMVSTPAPHSPWDAAPQYAKKYAGSKAPRGGSFNKHGKDKHWLIRQATSPMVNDSIMYLDNAFRRRWQTLLSVDDLVEKIVKRVEKLDQLDQTYFVYSSDNGYHMGQFSLPIDKRQLYETDVRVPLIVRGPNVSKNTTRHEPVLSIDLGPTFIDIATMGKGEFLDTMDGASLLPLFNVSSHPKTWRTDFLVEYNGEGDTTHPPRCPEKAPGVSQCFPDCVCEDAFNNTYSCVRTIDLSKKRDLMYCEFTDSETFVELYDQTNDPHQLKNIRRSTDPEVLVEMNKRLIELGLCVGKTCRVPTPIRRQRSGQAYSEAYESPLRRWFNKMTGWKKIGDIL